jgi:transcriptional regulator with PAS, ATPase and Fis domain
LGRYLEALVAVGTFRADLLYRLDVIRITIPPLRTCSDDIPVLLAHFLDRFATKYGRTVPEVPADVAQALLRYSWPGNVRELENVAEHLVVMGGRRSASLSPDDTFRGAHASWESPRPSLESTRSLEA